MFPKIPKNPSMYRQDYYLLDCSNPNSEQLVNCFQEHYMVTPPQNGKNLKLRPKKRRGETKNNYDKRRTHIQKLENQIKNIKNTLNKEDQTQGQTSSVRNRLRQPSFRNGSPNLRFVHTF